MVGKVTPLKHCGGKPRKLKTGSPEEKVFDPYASTEVN